MSGNSPTLEVPKAQARSRVTNGSKLLPGVDGRSWYARRARDLVALFVSNFGRDLTTPARRQRRSSAGRRILCVELENLEVCNSPRPAQPSLRLSHTIAHLSDISECPDSADYDESPFEQKQTLWGLYAVSR